MASDDAQKIQDAALNIVTTLKQIIEDKENELARYKKYMDDVKEEYQSKQTQDLNEIKRLNEIIFNQNMNLNAQILS